MKCLTTFIVSSQARVFGQLEIISLIFSLILERNLCSLIRFYSVSVHLYLYSCFPMEMLKEQLHTNSHKTYVSLLLLLRHRYASVYSTLAVQTKGCNRWGAGSAFQRFALALPKIQTEF